VVDLSPYEIRKRTTFGIGDRRYFRTNLDEIAALSGGWISQPPPQ
jgi:hypothetical protein